MSNPFSPPYNGTAIWEQTDDKSGLGRYLMGIWIGYLYRSPTLALSLACMVNMWKYAIATHRCDVVGEVCSVTPFPGVYFELSPRTFGQLVVSDPLQTFYGSILGLAMAVWLNPQIMGRKNSILGILSLNKRDAGVAGLITIAAVLTALMADDDQSKWATTGLVIIHGGILMLTPYLLRTWGKTIGSERLEFMFTKKGPKFSGWLKVLNDVEDNFLFVKDGVVNIYNGIVVVLLAFPYWVDSASKFQTSFWIVTVLIVVSAILGGSPRLYWETADAQADALDKSVAREDTLGRSVADRITSGIDSAAKTRTKYTRV